MAKILPNVLPWAIPRHKNRLTQAKYEIGCSKDEIELCAMGVGKMIDVLKNSLTIERTTKTLRCYTVTEYLQWHSILLQSIMSVMKRGSWIAILSQFHSQFQLRSALQVWLFSRTTWGKLSCPILFINKAQAVIRLILSTCRPFESIFV